MSEATVNGTPNLVLVDPANPNNILASYTPVTALVNEMAVSGNLLYTSSQQGLTIYNIGSFAAIPADDFGRGAQRRLDRGQFVQHPADPNHRRARRTKRSPGTRPGPTETRCSRSPGNHGEQPDRGRVAPVTLAGHGHVHLPGRARHIRVPGTRVTGVSIVSLAPASQTAQPGGTATYDVQLSNPTSSAVTYYLSPSTTATVKSTTALRWCPIAPRTTPAGHALRPIRRAASLHDHGNRLYG